MGHANIQTTMRYLHYAPREEDARLVAEAFQVEAPSASTRQLRATLETERDCARRL